MARFTHPAILDPSTLSNINVPHGQFISLTTQQAPVENVAQAVMFEHTVFSQDVTVEEDELGFKTKITFAKAGIYNLMFSGQLHNTGGGGNGQDVFMWFRQNGINIPDSNTRLSVSTNNPYMVAAWNIFVSVEAEDFVQLVGYPTNHHIVLEYIPAIPGDGPAIPSMILTVNQIA